MRRPCVTVLLLAALVVLGLTTAANAHVADRSASPTVVGQTARVEASQPPTAASAPVESIMAIGPTLPWVSLLALVFAASLIRPLRSRRAFVVLLVALLAVFTFEGAVHSVHHLGDEDAAAQCAVASASSNLGIAGASPVELIAPVETDAPAGPPEPGAPPRRFAPAAQGRAPPFLA
jgi:hypothetical protein